MRCGILLALAASALVLTGQAAAGVRVWFVTGADPVPVVRNGATIESAVQRLLAGPTAAERSKGIRSAVPPATPLLSVAVARRVVTVDLGGRFASGRDPEALRARVGQLVRTLRGIKGVRAVRILVDGGVPVGLFPGYDLRRPVAVPADDVVRPPTTLELQQRLVDLGFMGPAGLTGSVDEETSTAVLGFEKWAGLSRDGVLGPSTIEALMRAARPEPALRAPGRRIEVQLRRQLALLIENDRVVRAVHISSGAGGRTPTGSFRVYRKERYSWSVPFKVWLPWASYFHGGVAFHEFGSVPTYAASHGCIRVNHFDAAMLFGFAERGTPVDVFDEAATA
jgi:hypothetical protein